MGLQASIETVVEEAPPEVVKVRVRASSSPEGAITKVLAIGDAHDDPHTPKDRFRWLGKLAQDRGVDWIIQIGDFGSFDSLSSHIPNETLAGKLKNPYHHDIQSLNEAMGAMTEGLALGEVIGRVSVTLPKVELYITARNPWSAKSLTNGIVFPDLITARYRCWPSIMVSPNFSPVSLSMYSSQ